MRDILDNHSDRVVERKSIYKIAILVVVIAILYACIEYCRSTLPNTLIETSSTKIYTVGLFRISIVVSASLLIPKYLYRVRPKISSILVVLISVILIVSLEIFNHAIQIIHHWGTVIDGLLVISGIIKSIILVAIITLVIASFKVKSLRSKER